MNAIAASSVTLKVSRATLSSFEIVDGADYTITEGTIAKLTEIRRYVAVNGRAVNYHPVTQASQLSAATDGHHSQIRHCNFKC